MKKKLRKRTLRGLLLWSIVFLWFNMAHSKVANDEVRSVFDVQINLEFHEATLSQFFEEVEKGTTFSFIYSSNKVDLDQKVEIHQAYNNVGELLREISKSTSLRFKQINKNIVVSAPRLIVPRVAPAKGVIKGRVIDAQTGDVLPGATVKVAGTHYGAATNIGGDYVLNVESGEVTLEITYVGYISVQETIDVPASGTVVKNFSLNNDTQELESVVVVGVLQGQAKALNQQKSADNIKSIIAAEQIGRFPDPNVAEAIQRVPGAAIQRDQGEGRYVLVRGLAPQFTNISINGEQIPSPEADIRYIALDAIPADQLAAIEISKALTPDMDGDAVGGAVNLVTRKAVSGDARFSGTLIGGYNDLMGRPNAQGSLQYGQRFADDRLGVLLNSSYYVTERGSDNWERDASEIELRDYELTRTRLGLSGTIDYRISDVSEIYFRGIYNDFTDREWRRRYIFIPNVDDSPFEDHEIERAVKDRFESQTIASFNFGGVHTLPKFTIDYEAAYSYAEQDTPFDNEVVFIAEPDNLTTSFTNRDFASFTTIFEDEEALQGENRTFTPQTAYLNNSLYVFDELETGNTLAEDRNITGKFNVSVPYEIGGNNAMLKFGAKARFKEKTFDVVQNAFGWSGADDLLLSQFEGGLLDDNFLGGQYQLAANADMESVLRFFNNNRAGFELDVESKIEDENSESFTANEDVYAGYLMTRVQLDRLMLLGGVRYELTEVSYTSNTVFYDNEGDLDGVITEEGSSDYDFILPQLHLKYQIDNNNNIRAAATYSYARPNFENIVPQTVIELNEKEGTIGNPDLLPVSAFNLDLMYEKYYGNVGILSAGVFYKKLDDFIYNSLTEQEIDGVADVEVIQAVNGDQADLLGVELAYQRNFDFLPGILSGLGIYMNYTYTSSTASIVRGDVNEEITLPGQAEHIGNFSLSYDRGRFNTRLSANYRGSYLLEIGEEAAEDVYLNDRLQLDWTMMFAIDRKFRLFAEFLNLTDSAYEVYMGDEDTVIQREFYSWWSRIGVKFDF